ncbi:MAG: glycosyltransferase family 39 protein [Candidatus Eisenbacteria bacterium]
MAGASLAALGHRTAAARIPFAIAGLLTVLILWRFAHRLFQDPWMAALAPLFLATNTYWVLRTTVPILRALGAVPASHGRRVPQMDGSGAGRRGLVRARRMVLVSVDFGTFWPIVGLLGVVALSHTRGWGASGRASERASRGKPITGSGSAGSAEPVSPPSTHRQPRRRHRGDGPCSEPSGCSWPAWRRGSGYQLFGRYKEPAISWIGRAVGNLFHVNHSSSPSRCGCSRPSSGGAGRGNCGPVAASRYVRRRLPRSPSSSWRWSRCLCSISQVTAVTPWYFYRYFVALTPLTALLTAWAVRQTAQAIALLRDSRAASVPSRRGADARLVTVVLTAVLILTPWA